MELNREQLISIKRSYLNILALFLEHNSVDSRYFRCLLKWGIQLHLSPEDLSHINVNVSNLAYRDLSDKIEKIESIYHIIYMIYLDKVVEDVELEVASLYATKLGFDKNLVSELFKSIATAPYDRTSLPDVRQEVLNFMKVYDL